ncbi:MAG: pyridoxal-phosphate dependent enzyme [Thermoplasmata archaeon]
MSGREPIPLAQIQAAQERIAETAVRTPLIPLNLEDPPAEIYLKLENLQPVGSFKMRGAGNAVLKAKAEGLTERVWTVSAGNMAQGLAWYARHVGLPCSVLVPEGAPATKLGALERMGADIVRASLEETFRVAQSGRYAGIQGHFIHPFADQDVMAGNGTIGLEILEDLPRVDAVVIPYGGGGLSAGIASALSALDPRVRSFASEVETAAPLAASLAAGAPQQVIREPSFVDGIGHPLLYPDMWPLARKLLTAAFVIPLQEVVQTIRFLLERHRIVVEGAGATSVAAALTGGVEGERIVCVVSGGNLDSSLLETILRGKIP